MAFIQLKTGNPNQPALYRKKTIRRRKRQIRKKGRSPFPPSSAFAVALLSSSLPAPIGEEIPDVPHEDRGPLQGSKVATGARAGEVLQVAPGGHPGSRRPEELAGHVEDGGRDANVAVVDSGGRGEGGEMGKKGERDGNDAEKS